MPYFIKRENRNRRRLHLKGLCHKSISSKSSEQTKNNNRVFTVKKARKSLDEMNSFPLCDLTVALVERKGLYKLNSFEISICFS